MADVKRKGEKVGFRAVKRWIGHRPKKKVKKYLPDRQ